MCYFVILAHSGNQMCAKEALCKAEVKVTPVKPLLQVWVDQQK